MIVYYTILISSTFRVLNGLNRYVKAPTVQKINHMFKEVDKLRLYSGVTNVFSSRF